jgi:hypothetical protein
VNFTTFSQNYVTISSHKLDIFVKLQIIISHVMRNLEILPKKTKGKSEKLSLVPPSTLDFEATTPDKSTSENGSIPESELFVVTDPIIEKKTMKVLMSWKMPEMCPEFGI